MSYEEKIYDENYDSGLNIPNLGPSGDTKHGKAWTPEEDHKLLELVETHGSRKSAWPIIAQNVPGRTSKTCRIRWWRFIMPSLETHGRLTHGEGDAGGVSSDGSKKTRTWTKEEDEKLYQLVKIHGLGNWRAVAEHMPGRSYSACDLHWYLVVSKNLKLHQANEESLLSGDLQDTIGMKRRKWMDEDDEALKQLVLQHGSHSSAWPLIADALGRTVLACRWRHNRLTQGATGAFSQGYSEQQLLSGEAAPASADGTSASAAKRRRWTAEEDEQLREFVENRGTDSWAAISSKLESGRSSDACQYHWQYELYPKLLMIQQHQTATANATTASPARPLAHTYTVNSRTNEWYKWTPEEDEQLRLLIETYGFSGQATWEKIAGQMPGRTLNSCRMRWKQAIRPAISRAMQLEGGAGEGAKFPSSEGVMNMELHLQPQHEAYNPRARAGRGASKTSVPMEEYASAV